MEHTICFIIVIKLPYNMLINMLDAWQYIQSVNKGIKSLKYTFILSCTCRHANISLSNEDALSLMPIPNNFNQ